MRILALCTLATAILGGSRVSGFTFDDIEFWVGAGPHRAALVVDWSDADPHPPLAWGYRFHDTSTSEVMLRAIAMSDRRFYARLGASGPFGVPLYGLGYDQNGAGFALTDGTQFVHGLAMTGPSDGVTAIDSHDSYAEGWFDAFWALFVAADEPYGTGQWEMSGTGISDRILTDGDWDGIRFAPAAAMAPRFPNAAVRYAADMSSDHGDPVRRSHPVPEPQQAWWLLLAGLVLVAARAARGPALVIGVVGCGLLGPHAACHANQFATKVVQYIPGEGLPPGFDDPTAALGSPTRFTAPGNPFGGPVTPFNAPFDPEELVSIGFGGSLTLGFEERVFDRTVAEEFGTDFIVFGNSFFFDGDFPQGVVAGISVEPGMIEVSQDGVLWFAVAAMADTEFPTMGYQDVTDAFPSAGGQVPTNFFQPVDPNLETTGLTMLELIDAYSGSGGGTGVDIASTGLAWIQYVRVNNDHDPASAITPEVDAITVVPEPSGLALLVAGVFGWAVVVHQKRARGCHLPRGNLRR